MYVVRESKTVLMSLRGQEAGEEKRILKNKNIETSHLYINTI
jgi:hypothetical protein